MKQKEEFQGFNFTDEELQGLKTDFRNLKIVDIGRHSRGSDRPSDTFFSEKMIESANKIQDILFGKDKNKNEKD
jgi:hypothetical protein